MVRINRLDDWPKQGKEKAAPPAKRAAGAKAESSARGHRDSRPFKHLDAGQLMTEINEKGKDFVAAPSEDALASYRALIKEAIERAVASVLQVSREQSFSSSPKLFTIIAKIDTALLDLAEEVRDTQNGRIKIAGIVETIKGLVADILC